MQAWCYLASMHVGMCAWFYQLSLFKKTHRGTSRLQNITSVCENLPYPSLVYLHVET